MRLTDVATFTTVREVDAHVCGDDETPLTEIVDGTEALITDCRVHDRLTFRVPDDLSPGLYELQVLVPNVSDAPGWGDVLFSYGERITVVPPSTARFQIVRRSVAIFRETRRDLQVTLGSEKLATTLPPAARVRPASATPRTPLRSAPRHGFRK